MKRDEKRRHRPARARPGERSYLTEGTTLRSWLLSTDHKRIAILYAASITMFFFIGGAAATLIRLELFTPKGDLVTADTYNRLFTLHGVIMVWFFLVPSIPATLGNFLLPLMIGAKDVAFPRLNLMSWYLYVVGGLLHAGGAAARRGRYRLDLLHALLDALFQQLCAARRLRHLRRRLLVDRDRHQLHRHRPHAAHQGA